MPSTWADCICQPWLQCRIVLYPLFLLFFLLSLSSHAMLVWIVQVYFCIILLWCADLPLWGSVQFRDKPLSPTSQSFPSAIPLLYLTVYWYFWTFLCICTHNFKLDLLQEGQLCFCATALATLVSPGCCKAEASLQLLKSVKLERSWWECEWYLGLCRGWGQEVVPFLGKTLMQRVTTHCVILSILKGFTFSQRSLGCQASYECWLVSAGNEPEPMLLVK